MKDYDLDSLVENAINAGEEGVTKKAQLEGLVCKFMDTIAEKLSSHLGEKITLKKEPSLIDDGSSSSLFSFVSHKERSEIGFDVFVLKEKQKDIVTRRYKLFSYEYEEEKVLPVILRYGGVSVACVSEDKLIDALGGMFRARAVQLIEWCRNNNV